MPYVDEPLTIHDYQMAFHDHKKLVREIDVIINGEAGAAKQASLCDLVGQIKRLVEDRDRWVPTLGKPSALGSMIVRNPAPDAAAPQGPTGKYGTFEISR